ncbi:MAG: hypothetical protein Q7K43_04065, partial [Candidatus Woesearchaeota archaeon]|nr:hypothetical protein [Candidatus Woesearchaeota archaeon]
ELSNEINGTGIVLYGSYSVVPEGLHQNCLVNYSLSSLSQKRKMNLLRALYGYSSTKAGKKYNKQGIVSSITATKMGANQVLVRIGDINKITGLLKKFNVPFKIREIWSRNE